VRSRDQFVIGGLLAVTDANLILGRLLPSYFPKIFGKSEKEPLDVEASLEAFEELRKEINEDVGGGGDVGGDVGMGVDEVAYGFIKVANETMCRPIRALTESRGFATSKHILASFGGAGGQHACEIAQLLGIKTVLIHRHSSILSAYGLALADRAFELQEPCSTPYNLSTKRHLISRLDALTSLVLSELKRQGFSGSRARVERMLNMRFDGTDTALMVTCGEAEKEGEEFDRAFRREYKNEFGFLLEARIVVDDVKVRGIGKTFDTLGPSVFSELATISTLSRRVSPAVSSKIDSRHSVYFEDVGRIPDTPVYRLDMLDVGDVLVGPAMVVDGTQTIVIVPDAEAVVLSRHLVITITKEQEGNESYS